MRTRAKRQGMRIAWCIGCQHGAGCLYGQRAGNITFDTTSSALSTRFHSLTCRACLCRWPCHTWAKCTASGRRGPPCRAATWPPQWPRQATAAPWTPMPCAPTAAAPATTGRSCVTWAHPAHRAVVLLLATQPRTRRSCWARRLTCHGANPGLVQHFTKQVSKPCAQWDVGGKQASLGVGCNARTCILVCKLHAVLLCATSIHCIASALSKCRAADQQPCTVHDECQACSC